MDILGLIGQQYMFLLLVVLFLGFGLGTWAIIKGVFSKKEKTDFVKTKVNLNTNKTSTDSEVTKVKGDVIMNNKWIRLSVFSLVGIIMSISILGFVTNNNIMNTNYANAMNNHSGQTVNSSYDTNMQNQLYQMQMQLNQMQIQLQNMNSSSSSNMSSGSNSNMQMTGGM